MERGLNDRRRVIDRNFRCRWIFAQLVNEDARLICFATIDEGQVGLVPRGSCLGCRSLVDILYLWIYLLGNLFELPKILYAMLYFSIRISSLRCTSYSV